MDLKTTALFEQDGQIVHREAQDVEPIRKHCEFLRSAGIVGSGELKHAAKIPVVVSENWRKKRGISFHQMMHDPKIAEEFLASEDARPYRIWQGKV